VAGLPDFSEARQFFPGNLDQTFFGSAKIMFLAANIAPPTMARQANQTAPVAMASEKAIKNNVEIIGAE
jgi:hypothetical protein